MNTLFPRFVLKPTAICEFPDKTGAPCLNQATHLLEIIGTDGPYEVALCAECHRYATEERKTSW